MIQPLMATLPICPLAAVVHDTIGVTSQDFVDRYNGKIAGITNDKHALVSFQNSCATVIETTLSHLP